MKASATVLKFPANPAAAARRAAKAPREAGGNARLRLTEPELKRLKAEARAGGVRIEAQDADVPELRVRVSPTGGASFSIYCRAPGKTNPQRVTVGAHGPGFTVKDAQAAARAALVALKAGQDVNRAKATQRTNAGKRAQTVDALLADYLARKLTGGGTRALSPATGEKYRYDLGKLLGPAMFQPIDRLTPASLEKLYHARCDMRQAITNKGCVRTVGSKVSAGVGLYALAALCKFHGFDNLCAPLYSSSQVHKARKRAARMDEADAQGLLAWLFDAIEQNARGDNFAMQAEMLVLACTMGLRIGTLRALRWDCVKLDRAEMHFPAGVLKNKLEAVLPIPPRTLALLVARKKVTGHSAFVWPRLKQSTGHATMTSAFLNVMPLADRASPHDGRKLFALLAGRYGNANAQKFLMTHANSDDVTFANYTSTNKWAEKMKDMRPASDRIEAALLALCGDAATIRARQALHVERCTASHLPNKTWTGGRQQKLKHAAAA